MARTETDKLVVELEARVRDFERQMQRGSKTAGREFNKMRRDASKAGKDIEKSLSDMGKRVSGALSRLGLGGIAAGGIAGMVAGVASLAKGIAETGDAARRAGVDFKSFQQLAHVAKVNRIEVGKMTDGLTELQKRGQEFFTTGKGSAAEAFKALGYSADEVREKLKKPSEFLTEIIGKLGRLDKASQMNVADKLFGGSAAQDFVRLVDQGADGLRRTIAEGEALGAVLSDDVLAKAEELDGLIRTAGDTVGNHLKRAIIEAAWELARFLDSWRAFENQRTSTLSSRIIAIDKERLALENEILKLRHEQADITDNARDLGFGSDTAGVYSGNGDAIRAIEDRIAALSREGEEIEAILAARRDLETPPARGDLTFTPTDTEAAAARKKATDEIIRQRKAADELIASLTEELALVEATEREQEVANNLRRLGAHATDEQREKVISLTEALHDEREALEAAKKAQKEWSDSLEAGLGMVEDAILSIADGSVKAEDALKKLIIQLAIAAVKGMFLNQGPLAGFFKMPGFAAGGYTGERGEGDVAGVVHGKEFVVNAKATRKHRALLEAINDGKPGYRAGGYAMPTGGAVSMPSAPRIQSPQVPQAQADGGGPMNINVNVSGANGDQHIISLVHQGVQAGIKEYDRGSTMRVVAGVREASKRGMLR